MKPLKKVSFGAEDGSLAIKFHNGTEVVIGYIVKQTGTTRYIVSDGVVTKTCYLAQTTEEAENLTGNICTIEATTIGGVVYIKKMTSNQFTSTEHNIYLWQRDPDGSGLGQVTLLGGEVVIGPPGWVPPSAIAYAHFGDGLYYAFGEESAELDFFDPHLESPYGFLPRPLVDDGLIGSSSPPYPMPDEPDIEDVEEHEAWDQITLGGTSTMVLDMLGPMGALVLGQVRNDIFKAVGSTLVLELHISGTFVPGEGESFNFVTTTVAGTPINLNVSLQSDGVASISYSQGTPGPDNTHNYQYFTFDGDTVKLAVNLGPVSALSVNGSIPQPYVDAAGAGIADMLESDEVIMLFSGTMIKLADMAVYNLVDVDDLPNLSAVETAGEPSWFPDSSLVGMADFVNGFYYDGEDLVVQADLSTVEAGIDHPLYAGLGVSYLVEVPKTVSILNELKAALVAGVARTIVLETIVYSNEVALELLVKDSADTDTKLSVSVVTDNLDDATVTVDFADGDAPTVQVVDYIPYFNNQYRIGIHINGTSVLVSANGVTGDGITLSTAAPFAVDDIVRFIFSAGDDSQRFRKLEVYNGVVDQTQLNAMTLLNAYV